MYLAVSLICNLDMLCRPLCAPLPWPGKCQGEGFSFVHWYVCFVLFFKGFRLVKPKGRAQYGVVSFALLLTHPYAGTSE